MNTIPDDVVDEIERLTKLIQRTKNQNGSPDQQMESPDLESYKQRRRELLDRFDYEFHLRSTENETVLVCYPSAWMDNGIVDIEAIDDRDKAIERNLNSTHSEKDWETIYTINNEIATDVKESYGKIHGQTATAFSEFMSNHRMAPIWNATANDIIEFLQEYFVRNAWPTDAQSAVVNRSLRYTIEMAQERANSMDK